MGPGRTGRRTSIFDMLHILTITGPIYLLVAVGYAAVRFGVMQKSDSRVLGRFVLMFGMPALLFTALTQRHANAGIDWNYVLIYAAGGLLTMACVVGYARRIKGASVAQGGVLGMTVGASNSAFIGFPVLYQVLGPTAGVALAMCFIVENILIMPGALAYADSGGEGGAGAALRRSLMSLLTNPLLWGLALGLLCNLTGWRLPAVPERMVQMLSQVASPLALFAVGGSLFGLRLGHHIRAVVAAAGAKLLLHPALMTLLVLLFPVLSRELAVAAVMYAAMPTAAIVAVLAQRYQQEEFAAAAVMVATLASFFTITLLLMIVMPLLPAQAVLPLP